MVLGRDCRRRDAGLGQRAATGYGGSQSRPSLKILFASGYARAALMHEGRLDPDVVLLAEPYRKLELARMIRSALST